MPRLQCHQSITSGRHVQTIENQTDTWYHHTQRGHRQCHGPNGCRQGGNPKNPHNYSHDNELLRCFYRETTQKGRRYIYVAEAVTDLYKVGYNRLTGADRVAIERGRRLVSVRQADTLGAKIQGGPTLPVGLDLMKKHDLLLDEKELENYLLRMEVPVVEDDRPQLVISFKPARRTDHVLYSGRMIIDRQTLAFTRIEMSLDMSDESRATELLLLRKPAGVRFRPREFNVTVAYRYDGNVSRIHYLRSETKFYCEWKRKLFASPYHVEAEMVVTDLQSKDAQPISGKSSFSTMTPSTTRWNISMTPTSGQTTTSSSQQSRSSMPSRS